MEEGLAQGKTYAMVSDGLPDERGRFAEQLEGGLLDLGMTAASEPKDADVIILNTCSIASTPRRKVFARTRGAPGQAQSGAGKTLRLPVPAASRGKKAPDIAEASPGGRRPGGGPQYANRLGGCA